MTGYRVIATRTSSEIERFASWFHQDWGLIYPGFNEAVAAYVAMLSVDEKAVLRQELLEFVSAKSTSSRKSVMKAWMGLGACGWQRDLKLIPTLRDFAERL